MDDLTHKKEIHVAIIGDRGIPACYSGFSTLTEQMAVRMVNDYGWKVSVYCRSQYYKERPPYYCGVKCHYLPAPGGKNFESIIHSNLSILHAAKSRYDVALVLDPGNGPFVWPLRVRGTPLVMHTDGMGWKRKKWTPLQQKYYKWSEKITAKMSDWLVTDSKAMQQYYLDEYGYPSTYIPYSGEVGDGHSGLDDKLLQENGLKKGEYYICMARIEPDNNIDLLIREYRKSQSEKPLVVVGQARYDTDYGRMIAAESDDKVRCIGSVYEKNRVNALLTHSYAYLHGHEVGGTNPSLLNAMHMGAAPIPLDVIFHRQVMGEQGSYFTKRSGHLSDMIKELDKNPNKARELRLLAKKRSDQYYRWDAVVDAYVQLLQTVVHYQKQRSQLVNKLSKALYDPMKFYQLSQGLYRTTL